MSIADPIEQWTFEDFIEDMKSDAENGMYFEVSSEYIELFLRRLEERYPGATK